MTSPSDPNPNDACDACPLPIGPNEVVGARELAERMKPLSPAAARQAISRAAQNNAIWRSHHLKLSGGARIYARKSYAGQERFLRQLRPLLALRPGICRVLDEMVRQPAISEESVFKLLAATLDPTRYPDQRSVVDEASVLEELGIGKLDLSINGKPRFVRPSLVGTEESARWGHRLAARKLLDEQLTKLLVQQFKRQNFVSWGFEPDAQSEHQFNGQWFSAHDRCWLRPMLPIAKGRELEPCPVVFDVRATSASLADVQAFVARIRQAGYRPNSDLRVLGVMAARYFEPDAFELGRKSGFVMINLRQEIGEEALEALAAIERIISAEPQYAAPRTEFADLFTKLRYHPQAKQLAALAFECFTAAVVQADGWSSVQTNFTVRFREQKTGTWREVDVTGQRGDRHLAIECKALGGEKELSPEAVTKFFKQTVPSYVNHYAQKKKLRGLTAEIWTTGVVTEECQKLLAGLQDKADPTHQYALRGPSDIDVPTDVRSLEKLLISIRDL